MLTLYQTALRIRRSEPGLGDGTMTWLPSDPDVLAFQRGDGFANVTNLSADDVALPAHAEVLVASADIAGGSLPRDATAWLRLTPTSPDHGGG
jgi:alpha-glucosidase